MVCIFCNSCKKDADWASIDPHLTGKWYEMYSTGGRGGSCTFTGKNHMEFIDLAEPSSIKDDVKRSGEAKYKEENIILGESHFRIIEYPVPYDTVISYGSQSLSTHWRMRMLRAGNYNHVGPSDEGILYYRQ